MSNKLQLYLLRHAESQANLTHSFASQKLNLPLTEYGIEQSKQIAQKLKTINFEAIYSSPLLRAIETAEIISINYNLTPIISDLLREIDVGELDGKSINDIKIKQQYQQIIEQWQAGKHNISFVGGESLMKVKERILEFLCLVEKNNYSKILVVGHGLFFMAFIWLFCDNHGLNYESGRINRCHYSVVENKNGRYNIIEHDIAPENSIKGKY
ncbi:MAG: histidine phosphatase family protein [candidate division WOR-3 bacterium]